MAQDKSKSILWEDSSQLFNKKDFAEMSKLVNEINEHIEEERDNQKKLLDDLNELIQKEKEYRLEKENKVSSLIKKIEEKTAHITKDTTDKEQQLKKEILTLQQSIQMIQSNLSFSKKQGAEGAKQEDTPETPVLIDKQELKTIKQTVDQLNELVQEDKKRATELEKLFNDLSTQKDELIKVRESRIRKEADRIASKIEKINEQTMSKQDQLQKEVQVLQNSIRLIRDRLPLDKLGSVPEEEEPKPAKEDQSIHTEITRPKSKQAYGFSPEEQAVRREYPYDKDEDSSNIEIDFEAGEDDDDDDKEPGEKKKKGFGLFK